MLILICSHLSVNYFVPPPWHSLAKRRFHTERRKTRVTVSQQNLVIIIHKKSATFSRTLHPSHSPSIWSCLCRRVGAAVQTLYSCASSALLSDRLLYPLIVWSSFAARLLRSIHWTVSQFSRDGYNSGGFQKESWTYWRSVTRKAVFVNYVYGLAYSFRPMYEDLWV